MSNSNNKENITNVLKCTIDGKAYYIYSTASNNNELFKYFKIAIDDKNPSISDIDDIVNFLDTNKPKIIEIFESSVEYVKFLALKYAAENKIINQIKTKGK